MSQPVKTPVSPWPHRWAWLLACATFPLVWWGGFVSATGSGMAFRDWLTSDGVLMPLYPWLSSAGDKFIEHGHRLLGMLAGTLTIALVISTWMGDSRRWVRWYSVGLFGGVLLQGILGGMRVVLDQRTLALIHGVTGPVFFVGAVAMLAITSPRWLSAPSLPPDGGNERDTGPAQARIARPAIDDRLVRMTIVTAILAFLQLVLGAVVRHSPLMLADSAATIFRIAVYFHVLVAFVFAFYCLRLAHKCYWGRVCPTSAIWLAALVVSQLALGAATWLVKYGLPAWTFQLVGEVDYANHASNVTGALIAAGHGAIGSLLLAVCAVIVLAVARQRGAGAPRLQAPAPRITGVLA